MLRREEFLVDFWGGGEDGERVYGRKLQADEGRWETRVKISEMSRCCTLVSFCFMYMGGGSVSWGILVREGLGETGRGDN